MSRIRVRIPYMSNIDSSNGVLLAGSGRSYISLVIVVVIVVGVLSLVRHFACISPNNCTMLFIVLGEGGWGVGILTPSLKIKSSIG